MLYYITCSGGKKMPSLACAQGGGRPRTVVIYHNIIHVSCGNNAGVMVVLYIRTANDRGSGIHTYI